MDSVINVVSAKSISLDHDYHEIDLGTLISKENLDVSVEITITNPSSGARELILASKSCGCVDVPESIELKGGESKAIRIRLSPNSINAFSHFVWFNDADNEKVALRFRGRILPAVFGVKLTEDEAQYVPLGIGPFVYKVDLSAKKPVNRLGIVFVNPNQLSPEEFEFNCENENVKLVVGDPRNIKIGDRFFCMVPIGLGASIQKTLGSSYGSRLESAISVKGMGVEEVLPIAVVGLEDIEAPQSVFLANAGVFQKTVVKIRSKEGTLFSVKNLKYDESVLKVTQLPELENNEERSFELGLLSKPEEAILKTQVEIELEHPSQPSLVIDVYYR